MEQVRTWRVRATKKGDVLQPCSCYIYTLCISCYQQQLVGFQAFLQDSDVLVNTDCYRFKLYTSLWLGSRVELATFLLAMASNLIAMAYASTR